jgi:hypothetical protein
MRKDLCNHCAERTKGSRYDYDLAFHISISVIKSCTDGAV